MLKKLNFKMNIKAKSIAQEQIEECNPYPVLSTSLGIGSIICCGDLVKSWIQHTLYTTILNDQMVIWYSKKFSIPHGVLKTKSS